MEKRPHSGQSCSNLQCNNQCLTALLFQALPAPAAVVDLTAEDSKAGGTGDLQQPQAKAGRAVRRAADHDNGTEEEDEDDKVEWAQDDDVL